MTQKKLLFTIWLTALVISIVLLGLSAASVGELLDQTNAVLDRVPSGYLPDAFVTAVDVSAAYELLPHIGAVVLFGGLTAKTALDLKHKKAAEDTKKSEG